MVERMESSAPFNMALATLERINNILKNLSQIPFNVDNPFVALQLKIKLTKQLYLASVPLISDVTIKNKLRKQSDSLERLYEIKWNPVKKKKMCSYSKEGERITENVIQNIQEALQKEKYFMPPKSDPRYSWKDS